MINKRILSTLLALAILLSCVGWTPVQAQGAAPIDAEIPADQTSISTLPIEEEEDELPEREPIARLYDEEGDDLNKIVYLNNDGTRTMHLYDYPVKYRDASGEIHDISLEIADGTTELDRFQSAANSIMTAFPSKASDGISLSGEGVSIKLIPNIPEADTNTIHMTGYAKRIDSKTVSYDYDAKTTIEYSLTYTGFKEDIVVSEYTGQTEYEFLLQTNGLALRQIDGSFYLTDESGKIKAAIGDVIVFTADEKNNTMGTMEAETLKENHSYLLTIVLEAQYLADPNTAYPIRIDPTIDINYDANGSGAIEDVTIYSNVTPDGASTSLFVGLRETRGISRILMRFPNLDLSGLTGATVVSAEVTLRDLICEGTYLPVYCYPFTGANWTESTASWSMTQNWGPELDNQVISYSNGVNKNPKHRYTFNITAVVQGWINGTYSKAKGLIFKTSNEVETAATYEQRQFASYNRTNYRPTFTMDYVLPGSITAATNAVNEGGTLQLTAHMNGNVTWTSSDTTRATVSNAGLVRAKKAGQVIVTATCDDYAPATFTLWVTVANGVYYIKNASSGLCLQGTVGRLHINSHKSSQDTRLNQLWKITYLQNGQYVIRPIQNLSRALTVDSGGYVAAADAAITDSAVTSAFRWSISYNTSGYAIQQNGFSSKTVIPVVSSMPDSAVYTGTWSSSATCHWNLEKADGLFLRNIETLCTIDSSTVFEIEVGDIVTLSQLGIGIEYYGGYMGYWWSSNKGVVASVNSNGTVLGENGGETTISYKMKLDGVDYTQCFVVRVLIPDGTYYIRNRALYTYVQIDDQCAPNYTTADAILEVKTYAGESYQLWNIVHVEGLYYKMVSEASGLALSIYPGGENTGAVALVQRSYSGDDGQKWKIEAVQHDTYVLRAKTAENYSTDWCMSVGTESGVADGYNVEQKAYINDGDYQDSWMISTSILIGMSSDNYDSEILGGNDCPHQNLNSHRYADKFYHALFAPKDRIQHYNHFPTQTASPADFSENGAISRNIDFMIYIGHGHYAHDLRGNHLHYNCGIYGPPHEYNTNLEMYTSCESAGNVYTNNIHFGSNTSNLRWVWLYTCNFLQTNQYVSDDSLKAMMNGVHIILGYGSTAYLCDDVVLDFASNLSKGRSIIDSFFIAGDNSEANVTEVNHIQKVLYIEPARNETVFSPFVRYGDSAAIKIIKNETHDDGVIWQ